MAGLSHIIVVGGCLVLAQACSAPPDSWEDEGSKSDPSQAPAVQAGLEYFPSDNRIRPALQFTQTTSQDIAARRLELSNAYHKAFRSGEAWLTAMRAKMTADSIAIIGSLQSVPGYHSERYVYSFEVTGQIAGPTYGDSVILAAEFAHPATEKPHPDGALPTKDDLEVLLVLSPSPIPGLFDLAYDNRVSAYGWAQRDAGEQFFSTPYGHRFSYDDALDILGSTP